MLQRGTGTATPGVLARRDPRQRQVLLALPPQVYGVRAQRCRTEGIVQTRSLA